MSLLLTSLFFTSLLFLVLALYILAFDVLALDILTFEVLAITPDILSLAPNWPVMLHNLHALACFCPCLCPCPLVWTYLYFALAHDILACSGQLSERDRWNIKLICSPIGKKNKETLGSHQICSLPKSKLSAATKENCTKFCTGHHKTTWFCQNPNQICRGSRQ